MSSHPMHGHPGVREVGVPVATLWTSPAAPRRGLDDGAVADLPDPPAWAARLDEDGTPDPRLGLHGRTLSQLLLGEPVLVLEEGAGWSKVAALWQPSAAHEHGYQGWLRTAHLAAAVDRTSGLTALVTAATAALQVEGESDLAVSCGTALWVEAPPDEHRPDQVVVLLPGGRRGRLPRDAVRLSSKAEPASPTVVDLLATARQFLGLRYLWGGTSAWGLDCSGLVHLTFRAHGVLLPRDASDQATTSQLESVDLAEVRAGDLYFFARPEGRVTHVGFATAAPGRDGSRPMLHAPEGGGLLEEAPMTQDRAATLVAAARRTG